MCNKEKILLDYFNTGLSVLGFISFHSHTVRLIISLFVFLPITVYSQTRFVDVTNSKQILPLQAAGTFGSGVSAADFDNDGNIDLFVPTDENFPNHLYRNLGNGKFEEIGSLVGVADKMRSRAALWFDYNGDHLLDLIVAGDCRFISDCPGSSVIRLYQQKSPSNFVDVTESSGLTTGVQFTSAQMVGGLAAGDFNNDGYLDIMISYWQGQVYLYLNKGDGTFADIGTSNLTALTHNYFQPLLYDFNKDSLLDIYLNVDGGANLFWLNDGGNSFTEMAYHIQLNSNLNEMGTALGDYDNDEDMDIYITNVTGNLAHNVLFRNDSNEETLSFTETAKELGVHEGGWGWGTTFFDADNDGFLDLAETNGLSFAWRMPTKFWFNDGRGSFRDASAEVGFVNDLDGTALIALDFDRDGDLDLVESHKSRPGQNRDLRLLENQLNKDENSHNYVVIKPRMIGLNHFAIGSTVTIRMDNITMSRPILAGNSFFGQEPAEAFFGLGTKTQIDEIIVEWPGGTISSLKGINEVNQVITITDEDLLHKPTDLRIAEMNLENLILNWNHISTRETGFVLQRSRTAGFDNVVEFIINKDSRAITNSNLEEGTSYYYRIKAVNDKSSSEFSEEIEVVYQELVETPTELKALQLDHKEAHLEWNDNSDNENAFEIQRSRFQDFREFSEFTVAQDITRFSDTALNSNTDYYYRVRAIGEKGTSPFCEPLNIITFDFIKNPKELNGFSDEQQVRLSWIDQADNETGYLVERSVSPLFQYTTKFLLQKDISHFIDTEIVPETPFFYRVSAYNEKVVSDFSNIISLIVHQEDAHQEPNDFYLFPNPSKGFINIRFTNSYKGLVTIIIANPVGQILFNKVYEKTAIKYEQLVEFNSSPGIYFLSLTTKNTKYEQKLLLTE